ncbi:DUF4349 domain-containing protein [Leptospira gomenensis]|uniref:DUF4349 domain-containing protein n=2 Tax=Leptospira gomenensis TaxID=2484974 RepID=A0A5F1Y9J1_9LEPT|nr:DUF4349 domain-containing protein [Leptospira gomenensis]TGK43391.1 DUF4349 domain-containing protein [Leptospira gomenensis]TGK45415.1 DUF4349 domain-containing protein [Leptospira gomenensis]TGK66282.1 DUF4349 domain-containing protein [Leptospira gomenensis]
MIACGKKESPNENSPASESSVEDRLRSISSKTAPAPPGADKQTEKKREADFDISGETAPAKEAKDQADNQLGAVFAPINGLGTERLLEYNIQLSYQCDDLVKTRKELLNFVSKYGYLETSSAFNGRQPSMSVRMHVRSAKLYEALQELDRLGSLLTEDISTVDHTEGMVWQKRKTSREKIRLTRRNNANNQIGAGAKNWEAVEESVSSSEDELDLAEHETWKIKDRVQWATISVSYGIPIPSDAVQVPEYKNALVGILNLFLQLTYYFLWWLPFLLFGGTAVYYTLRIYKKWKGRNS